MFIDDLLSTGSIPSLEMTLRFAGQRQEIINHNIANLSTPNFRPVDADPAEFQRTLARAIEDRRERTGGMHGDLRWEESGSMRKDGRGDLRLMPGTPSGHI